MIQQIQNLPANMVGFKASGEVTEDDFKNVVLPQVEQLLKQNDKLNYMLVLDTEIKNFTAGAWLQDALLGLKHLTKWNRAAIVSDNESVIKFTEVFSKMMIGEFKGFKKSELDQAIHWTSEKVDASA